MNNAAASPDHQGYIGAKRGLDSSEHLPSKKLKQMLHDGFVMYGQEWANQAFQGGKS